MSMERDNRWHPAVVVKGPKFFGIFNNFDEAEISLREQGVSGEVEGHEVKWNWNNGQPLVDFATFMMACVDTQKVSAELSELGATLRGTFKSVPKKEARKLRAKGLC